MCLSDTALSSGEGVAAEYVALYHRPEVSLASSGGLAMLGVRLGGGVGVFRSGFIQIRSTKIAVRSGSVSLQRRRGGCSPHGCFALGCLLCAEFRLPAFLRTHPGEGSAVRLLWLVVLLVLIVLFEDFVWVFCCLVVGLVSLTVAASVVNLVGRIPAVGCYVWE
ncbi:hypothetical protein RHMOL_Rhmol02G0275300 [Rhododendron molle]|uniref:Uncharacterized protein n=1 Tax=Rhododendron molle TaxID=49168 RepID=A0ACC0PUF7_RHOML|nr:hypothetical protein RHMOL_Rhmol02G0275300 [Rhododendron molle]